MSRVASAVWRVSPELVLALDAQIGIPVDTYVNGTQTWLTDDGPGGATLEWRLHPVASYSAPPKLSHYDLWEQVVTQLTAGGDAGALALGGERRGLASIWDGLEAYAAYGDEVEPATLAQAAATALGRAPLVVGLVDHDRLGDTWEQTGGNVSLIELLFEELKA